jgi:hypothetical protein
VKRPDKAAVLFAGALGNAGGMAHCAPRLREAAFGAGGEIIKTMVEEILAVFPTPDAAAAAAARMQTCVAALPPMDATRLALRVGFHAGPVFWRDGDVFGDTVNVAARLAGHAARGQILTSRDTAALLSPAMRSCTRTLYEVPLKGKANRVELVEVLWQQDADVTDVPGQGAEPDARLRLFHRGREIDVLEGGVNIGRDRECDVVIDDEHVSRRHCTLARRHGKVVVQDHSANGTYVSIDGKGELVLHREDYILRGRGHIALGQPRAQSAETIEYLSD